MKHFDEMADRQLTEIIRAMMSYAEEKQVLPSPKSHESLFSFQRPFQSLDAESGPDTSINNEDVDSYPVANQNSMLIWSNKSLHRVAQSFREKLKAED